MNTKIRIGIVTIFNNKFVVSLNKKTLKKEIMRILPDEKKEILIPPTIQELLYFENQYNRVSFKLYSSNKAISKKGLVSVVKGITITISLSLLSTLNSHTSYQLQTNHQYSIISMEKENDMQSIKTCNNPKSEFLNSLSEETSFYSQDNTLIKFHYILNLSDCTILPSHNPTMDELIEVLNENKNLDGYYKQCILEHIGRLKKYEPNIDLRIYKENLRHLTIKKLSKDEIKKENFNIDRDVSGLFNSFNIQISLLESLDKEQEKDVLAHELGHMSNSLIYKEHRDNECDINSKPFSLQNNFGSGLKESFNSAYTKKIGYEQDGYLSTYYWAIVLANIIGEKKTFKINQEGSILDIYQELISINPDSDKALQLISLFDISEKDYEEQNIIILQNLLTEYFKLKFEKNFETKTDFNNLTEQEQFTSNFLSSLRDARQNQMSLDKNSRKKQQFDVNLNPLISELFQFLDNNLLTVDEGTIQKQSLQSFKNNINYAMNQNNSIVGIVDQIVVSPTTIQYIIRYNSDFFENKVVNNPNQLYLIYGTNIVTNEKICMMTTQIPLSNIFVPNSDDTVRLSSYNLPVPIFVEKYISFSNYLKENCINFNEGENCYYFNASQVAKDFIYLNYMEETNKFK